MQRIRKIAIVAPVQEFLTRHQVFARLALLGIGQTAVLVAVEVSNYFLNGRA